MNAILTLIIGYLLGSISTSILLSRLMLNDDIRKHGSGNPGASNMIRTFGIKYGAAVLIGDALKGVLAALIGQWLLGMDGAYYGALAAVLGHNWSIFLGFKGGKGVATTFGAMAVIMPWWTLGAAVIFIITILVTRYFSLASMTALVFIWLAALIFHISNVALFLTCTALTGLSLFQHRGNIQRLLKGTENRWTL